MFYQKCFRSEFPTSGGTERADARSCVLTLCEGMRIEIRGHVVVILCILLAGCCRTGVNQEENTRLVGSSVTYSKRPLPPDAQAELDQLNSKCESSAVWCSEFEMLERPETRPPDYALSGECSAFAQVCKQRLAAMGVKVRWNSETKRYEVAE